MKKRNIIGIVLLTFLLDQISKLIIMKTIKLGSSIKIIKNFFSLTYTNNYGAAFGIFENKIIFIVLVSLILLGYLIYEIIKNKNKRMEVISISLIIGGLLGNLTDRIVFGYVRDFLDFTIFNYDFAIFNLSDSFIVIGAFLFIIMIIKEEYHEYSIRRRNN